MAEWTLGLRPQQGRNGLVFPHPATGKPYTEVKKGLKMACNKAGITSLRFHDLRHAGLAGPLEAGPLRPRPRQVLESAAAIEDCLGGLRPFARSVRDPYVAILKEAISRKI